MLLKTFVSLKIVFVPPWLYDLYRMQTIAVKAKTRMTIDLQFVKSGRWGQPTVTKYWQFTMQDE